MGGLGDLWFTAGRTHRQERAPVEDMLRLPAQAGMVRDAPRMNYSHEPDPSDNIRVPTEEQRL